MTRMTAFAMAVFAASSVQAAPYCADLLNKDALPSKYAKTAPVFSNAESGWIFTQDQLKDRYDMKSTSLQLMEAIVDEFDRRDVALAIVVAPPRPVVAGQATLDAAMQGTSYDVEAAEASFAKLIEGLRGTGALVPDLSAAALSTPEIREEFYFRRDTHWTPTGATVSAAELARIVNENAPDLLPNDGMRRFADLSQDAEIEEEGSLAKIVRTVCGTSLADEAAVTFDLTRAGSLLGGGDAGAEVALLGSSFSNRYKRDFYRFGDALAWALDTDIENLSISGGGPIGAMEAYVLSGALDRREHSLVIWELPYTESFNSTSFLRQLLGALQQGGQVTRTAAALSGASSTASIALDDGALSGVTIEADDASKQSFRLEILFDNGSTSKMSLSRRKSVPVDMRADELHAALGFFGNRTPVEITVSTKGGSKIAGLSVY